MRKSLGLKMTMILSVTVFLIILCSLLASNVLLSDYYSYGKQQSLIRTYEDINRTYKLELSQKSYRPNMNNGGTSFLESLLNPLSEELQDSFEQMAENRSVSILIFRDSDNVIYDIRRNTQYKYQPIIYSSIGMDTKDSVENNNMYSDFVNADQSSQVIMRNSQYQIQQIYVSRLGSEYLYLSAVLDNGDYLLLRASYDSMQESVGISIRFILYISVAMLIIGICIIFLVIQRMVRPVVELSNIAREMSYMNFDTKYEVKTNDEIGELGGTINLLSENLEKTMAELKSANRELKKDLEIRDKNEQMRKEFLSNVSHELKTPIALIQGYAEGLMENISDDAESREFYCEVIVDEANKMNNLVKKLLDLNQLEFGDNHVNMEHFNLADVIHNYLSNAEILFKQKDVKLELNIPDSVYVWADAYMVEEIFNNYLSNALNHVDGERIIRISTTMKDGCVRVSVFNTGACIPEADINQIWDKFYKVDKARTREYGGSGVGLSIVKASVELLGQDYGVENKDAGVEFWFELDAS